MPRLHFCFQTIIQFIWACDVVSFGKLFSNDKNGMNNNTIYSVL